MKKILINLFVPAIEKNFDVFVPSDMLVSQIKTQLIEGVSNISGFKYVSSGDENLCVKCNYEVLNDEKYIGECDVCDGDTIILL